MSTAQKTTDKGLGYQTHSIGGFTFERDEYFAHIFYPGGRHIIPIDAFLRALMRDVAWGFFYGTVNFDNVFGTVNHYGTVEMFIGLFNEAYRSSNRHHVETFESKDLKAAFEGMLNDWVHETFDPFAAPDETGLVFGAKNGNNKKAISRQRMVATRMVGLPGDLGYRTDENGYPVNRQFTDVQKDKPEVYAEPGFEKDVHAYSFLDYVTRSGRHVEPVGGVVRQGQPVLRHDRGAHAPDHPRERPRRVVHPGLRRDHLGRGRPRHG